MKVKPETAIDGYKVDHRRQYLYKTEDIGTNFTPRKTRRSPIEFMDNGKRIVIRNDKPVFFLLQYLLKEYLIKQWNEEFFLKPMEEVTSRFRRRINNYLGPNEVGDQHIRELHSLGYLPIEILALPEGTAYNLRVPCLFYHATNGDFGWLVNYFETILSTTIWGGCTSATTAHQYKKLLNYFAMETVGNTDFVQWQGHDFSFRGMFGMEAACMSGAAHLLSFTGTDTIPAIDFLEEYYNADCEKELIGGSVAATEHSVACSIILDFVNKVRIENAGSKNELEIYDEKMVLADIEYVRHLICDVYPKGIISVVSDSFDYWNTITNTAKVLKNEILSRDGKVVFRPDTGDPVKIVCGYDWREAKNERDLSKRWFEFSCDNIEVARVGEKYYRVEYLYSKYDALELVDVKLGDEIPECEAKGSIECLWNIFGGAPTEKGYKQLDSHVGLIYGDSITLKRCLDICLGLKNKKFASTNVVYGIGSYTYQYVTRDTDGYAAKATYAKVNGIETEIYKKPKTDDGTKNSAVGLVAVYKNEIGEFYLKDRATWDEVYNCELKPVFKDGKLLKDWTLAEVRANLQQYE